jgi:hypothetical protein
MSFQQSENIQREYGTVVSTIGYEICLSTVCKKKKGVFATKLCKPRNYNVYALLACTKPYQIMLEVCLPVHPPF